MYFISVAFLEKSVINAHCPVTNAVHCTSNWSV